LQHILETRFPQHLYEVKSFGRCGARAGHGNIRYIDDKQYRQAISYGARLNIIMLGTNDALSGPIPIRETFEEGLMEVVESVRRGVPGCAVMLVQPPGCKAGRCSQYLHSVIFPGVQTVAKSANAPLVQADLVPNVAYSQDMVHLSRRGAEIIAEVVAGALVEFVNGQ
jgi:lysophospholipase L1-like esterase